MRDEHLTPVLTACSESELALLVEFLGRPPSGLAWLDRRVREPEATREDRVAAIVERILRVGAHSVSSRIGGGLGSYLQIVCDALYELELPETPDEQGIHGLELRLVRFVLDTEFERLTPEAQASLWASFESGAFFRGGIHSYGPLDPFLTHTDAEHTMFEPGKAARAIGTQARRVGVRQVRTRLRNLALRVVLRRLASPIAWAITVWDYLGPAYRYTVPVICFVAYLRHRQLAAAHDEAGTPASHEPVTNAPA